MAKHGAGRWRSLTLHENELIADGLAALKKQVREDPAFFSWTTVEEIEAVELQWENRIIKARSEAKNAKSVNH